MAATKTDTQIGQSDWRLTAIANGSGECDHCGRELKHLYKIHNTVTEREMTVGRGCVKKITGWTLALAEAQRLIRVAERRIVRTANWAAFTAQNPQLAERIEADIYAYENDGRTHECGGAAHEVRFNISDGRVAGWEREYAQRYAARASAGI